KHRLSARNRQKQSFSRSNAVYAECSRLSGVSRGGEGSACICGWLVSTDPPRSANDRVATLCLDEVKDLRDRSEIGRSLAKRPAELVVHGLSLVSNIHATKHGGTQLFMLVEMRHQHTEGERNGRWDYRSPRGVAQFDVSVTPRERN